MFWYDYHSRIPPHWRTLRYKFDGAEQKITVELSIHFRLPVERDSYRCVDGRRGDVLLEVDVQWGAAHAGQSLMLAGVEGTG